MKHWHTLIATFAIATMMLASATPAHAAGPDYSTGSAGAAALDALVVRPVALVGSFIGTGLYAGTVPLTFLTDVDEPAAEYLMSYPWWFSSGRPLGRFDVPKP